MPFVHAGICTERVVLTKRRIRTREEPRPEQPKPREREYEELRFSIEFFYGLSCLLVWFTGNLERSPRFFRRIRRIETRETGNRILLETETRRFRVRRVDQTVTLRLLVYFILAPSPLARGCRSVWQPPRATQQTPSPCSADPGATPPGHSLCTRFDPPHLDKIENNRKSSPSPHLVTRREN